LAVTGSTLSFDDVRNKRALVLRWQTEHADFYEKSQNFHWSELKYWHL